jgi:hypothetical protein
VLFEAIHASVINTGVQLTWAVQSDETIAAFAVVRTLQDAAIRVGADLPPTAHDFVDTTAQPNTTYRYAVIASTVDGNIFKSQAVEVSIPSAKLSLAQNEPNPFNPNTRIEFAIPEASIVDVSVYDVSGRRVITLVAGPRAAGHSSIQWNGTNSRGNAMGSGVYFLRLTAGGETRTRKMVLMK